MSKDAHKPVAGSLREADPEVFAAIQGEVDRQSFTLEMIASENFVSRAVREATGSVMTNKYAEGYPGKRYYGGCEHVDQAENLAIARAKQLFKADHANVQPHSGSQANMAAYMAAMQPGDHYLGMNLAHGGHLTHGSPVNFSGQLYVVHHYGVDKETERIDMAEVRRLALEVKPKLIMVGASAYPRFIDYAAFREVADEVGAVFVADVAHVAGMMAVGLHPDAVGPCDIVTTTTHKTLRGPRAGLVLCKEKWAKPIDKAIFPGMQGGPLMHVIAAKAVAFGEALRPEFKAYQQRILDNAQALAEALLEEGLHLVSGGTDNHLMLVDLTSLGITGKDAQKALEAAGITVNKNTIPYETQSPFVTSGIRIGTPALTTRGMGTDEMRLIAAWIVNVLRHAQDEATLTTTAAMVRELCTHFPGCEDF